jgi:hypothetical protein
MNNRISLVIEPEVEQQILHNISVLANSLPEGLVILTEDERKSIAKMGDKSGPFTEKALEIAGMNPALKPAYVDLNESCMDMEAYKSLNRILRALTPVVNKLKDSVQLCGHEVYTAALSIYGAAKDGEHRSVDGAREAVQALSLRFPGRKPAKPVE